MGCRKRHEGKWEGADQDVEQLENLFVTEHKLFSSNNAETSNIHIMIVNFLSIHYGNEILWSTCLDSVSQPNVTCKPQSGD